MMWEDAEGDEDRENEASARRYNQTNVSTQREVSTQERPIFLTVQEAEANFFQQPVNRLHAYPPPPSHQPPSSWQSPQPLTSLPAYQSNLMRPEAIRPAETNHTSIFGRSRPSVWTMDQCAVDRPTGVRGEINPTYGPFRCVERLNWFPLHEQYMLNRRLPRYMTRQPMEPVGGTAQ